MTTNMTRRRFGQCLLSSAGSLAVASTTRAQPTGFRLRYIVGSSLFGELPLDQILPQVRATGSEHIDIWPRVHGNQREQMDEMGHEKFEQLLGTHAVKLGCVTRYDLGPFGLQKEMEIAHRFHCQLLICGGAGPKNLQGAALKAAVRTFTEKLKPHLERAGDLNVSVAIENHGNNLIDSPDSLKWLVEFAPSKQLGLALAPYHLENLGLDAPAIARLIKTLGSSIRMLYAWQHGMGCMKKLPKEQELLQMPGRGKLNFVPIVAALKEIRYTGFTQIFMHPVPRGIPILPTAGEVADEINRARRYLTQCLAEA